ncbi:MAG TPA: (d)CMP kinase [Dongiaceae bacterium]|jgi:cytidylate kinase|nr:(d)CMP kinase [Dongiaceae bacterium]
MNLVIAIDGPAAAGKGTLARRLAEHYDLAYLDSGSLYRGTALCLLRRGQSAPDEAASVAAAKSLPPELLGDPELRAEATGALASKVAAIPAVRAALLAWQRGFAAAPPGGKRGAVLDGRDIGTVVLPDAMVKFWIVASDEARAERRFKELQAKGEGAIYAQVLEDMRERDARDTARATAPMKPAEDAEIIDTSALDADQVFQRAREVIDRKLRN